MTDFPTNSHNSASTEHSKSGLLARLSRLVALAGAGALVVAACSGDQKVEFGDSGSNGPGSVGPCEDGASRSCSVTMEQGNGSMLCYHGTQTCESGNWGPCGDGHTQRQVDPTADEHKSFRKVQSLSVAKTCYTSSSCDALPEWDSAGLGVGGAPAMTYSTGDIVRHGAAYYQCNDGALCNVGADISEPAEGSAWSAAWTYQGSCSGINPCDAGCMYFEEDPSDITPGVGGAAPIGLPSFPPTSDVIPCSHDICTVTDGTPLDDNCNSCVGSICAKAGFETCCTTGWTQACAEEAYLDCYGIDVNAGGICDYGVFSEFSLGTANRPSSNALLGSRGDVEIGTDADLKGGGVWAEGSIHFASLNGKPVAAGKGVLANGDITAQSSASKFTGFMKSGGNLNLPKWIFEPGSSVEATGTLSGQDSTKLNGTFNLRGEVIGSSPATYVAPLSGSAANFEVLGTECDDSYCSNLITIAQTYEHETVSLPEGSLTNDRGEATAIPTLATDCSGSTTYSAANNGWVDVPGPGVYRSVDVRNDGNLRLVGGGTYYFNEFRAKGSTIELQATAPDDVFDIRVCGTVLLDNDTIVTGSGPGMTNDSAGHLLENNKLIFYADTQSQIDMGTNVWFSGMFIAPNTSLLHKRDVTVSNVNDPGYENGTLAAPVNGGIWARAVTFGTNALTYQITSEDCTDLSIPDTAAGPPAVCPDENFIIGAPGALVDPCFDGQDCQLNHRCVEPETDSTCASSHSKCEPGAAFDLSSCSDSCIEDICAADSTCCDTSGGSWDAVCVSMVSSVCDAVCGDVECTHEPCTEGARLLGSCDAGTCIETVCGHDPSCCVDDGDPSTDDWDAACVALATTYCGTPPTPEYSPPTKGDICDYAVYGEGSIAVKGQHSATSLRASISGGAVGTTTGATMTPFYVDIDGDLILGSGAASMHDAHISGGAYSNLTSNPALWGFSASTVGGAAVTSPTQVQYSPVSSVTFPEENFSCTSTTDAGDGTSLVDGAERRDVVIPDGGTLTLTAGTYIFNSLTLGTAARPAMTAPATLVLPASGDVNIKVCGNVHFRGGATMTNITQAEGERVYIYSEGNILYNESAVGYGFMISDGGDVGVYGGSKLYGAAWSSNTVNVQGALSTLDASGLADDCEGRLYGSSPSEPNRMCAYSSYFSQGSSVSLANSVSISGGDFGTTSGVSFASGSVVNGSVYTGGATTFQDTAVLGDVKTSTGAISKNGTSTIAGTESAGDSDTPRPTFPTWAGPTCSSYSGPTALPSGSEKTFVAGGTYNQWYSSNGHSGIFQAGKTYINRLEIRDTNYVYIPDTGVVEIFVCKRLRIGQGVEFRVGTPSSYREFTAQDSARLVFHVESNWTPAVLFDAGQNGSSPMNDTYGTYIAYRGQMSFQGSRTYNGIYWGNRVNITGASVNINGAGATGSSCEALGIDTPGASSGTCPSIPVTKTGPNESATCTSNTDGYIQECSTLGYDLALEYPCDDELEICNHGDADFPAGPVDVGFWSYARNQMSYAEPTVSPDELCTLTVPTPIIPGTCYLADTSACNLPAASVSEPATLMVDPEAKLTECDGRVRDNWSVDDGRTCNPVMGGTLTVDEDYAAVCPKDTVAQWGVVTWETQTPGLSVVNFYGMTQSTQAELDTAMAADVGYTLLGTASAAGSSESCPVLSSCMVDITSDLGLSQSQDQFFGLKMELISDGADAPTLEDWQVTYSCVYDE